MKLHSNTTWRGALYNAVRAARRGVKGAAGWLLEERGVKISQGALYKKLDGTAPAETVTIELAELLTEFAIAEGVPREDAINWIKALAARHDAVVLLLGDGVPQDIDARIDAIKDKGLLLQESVGVLSAALREALADLDVCHNDSDRVGERIMSLVYLLLRLRHKVELAAGPRGA